MRPSVTACRGVETRRGDEIRRHGLRQGAGAMAAGLAVVLAAGIDLAQEALAREHDAIGDDLALGDGGAEPPGRADEHLPLGGFAQAATRGAGLHQRLDQHGHGRVRGGKPVVVHVAAGIGGPQRGPARAHGGEERGFVVDAEKALELAGEIGALAILDQGGRAHRARTPARFALRPPCGEQRREDFRRDRRLVEAEPDLDRQTPLLTRVSAGKTADQGLEPQRRDLRPIGLRAQAEAARRRQARHA